MLYNISLLVTMGLPSGLKVKIAVPLTLSIVAVVLPHEVLSLHGT
jgi:hypothetical protein